MANPALEVADIFRIHGPAWRLSQRGHLSLGQLKGKSWIACRPGFFLPVRVLSRLLRRRFIEERARAHGRGELRCWGEHAPLADGGAFARWLVEDPRTACAMTCPINRQSDHLPTTRLHESTWLHTTCSAQNPRSDAALQPQARPPIQRRAAQADFVGGPACATSAEPG
ncbi:MAG: hypothetical protein ABI671_05135 [Burkholderiales bacterium]